MFNLRITLLLKEILSTLYLFILVDFLIKSIIFKLIVMFSNFENRTGSWERDTQTHTSESHFIGMEKNTVHIIQESSLVNL